MPCLVASGFVLVTIACVSCSSDGDPSYGDDVGDRQLPARGGDDMPVWLAAGHYLDWECEPEPHEARAPSPHGTNRICNNDALHQADGTGAFPIGAASVKELYEGDDIRLFAVYRKVAEGEGGDTWYWYEGREGDVVANGEGESGCTGCHAGAPRDFVFTVVP